MIEVMVAKNGVLAKGHAGHAEQGKDIVCAAVSSLAQTLAKSLEGLTGDRISYEIKPGYAYIRFGSLSEHGKLLVDSFFIGICGIADTYPECVQIK